jgi:hypothetical protein
MSTDPRLEELAQVPESLWERLRARPERAPELIAVAACERFAPGAQRWVESAGGKPPDKLAREAVKRHVRLARVEGATLGIGGALTSVADLTALAWLQSRMVLYVAAAYGFDPHHPMRPAELLALHGLYPTAAAAREALDGLGKPMAQAMAEKALSGGRDQRVHERLLRFVGRRVARRYAGRLVPLISSPIAAFQNADATKEMGRQATAYYGGR